MCLLHAPGSIAASAARHREAKLGTRTDFAQAVSCICRIFLLAAAWWWRFRISGSSRKKLSGPSSRCVFAATNWCCFTCSIRRRFGRSCGIRYCWRIWRPRTRWKFAGLRGARIQHKIDAHIGRIKTRAKARGDGLFSDRHQPSAGRSAAGISGGPQAGENVDGISRAMVSRGCGRRWAAGLDPPAASGIRPTRAVPLADAVRAAGAEFGEASPPGISAAVRVARGDARSARAAVRQSIHPAIESSCEQQAADHRRGGPFLQHACRRSSGAGEGSGEPHTLESQAGRPGASDRARRPGAGAHSADFRCSATSGRRQCHLTRRTAAASFGELARYLRTLSESTHMPLEVHLASDMQKSAMPPGFMDDSPRSRTPRWCSPGGKAEPNWTVENVVAPRRIYDPKKVHLAATVAGFGSPAAKRTVSLVLNGKVLQTKSVDVGENGRAQAEFLALDAPYGFSRGEVRIDSADVLPADDSFPFAVERTDPRKVLFIDDGRHPNAVLYFKAALDSTGDSAFHSKPCTPSKRRAHHSPTTHLSC